jgi:hypothetical protein
MPFDFHNDDHPEGLASARVRMMQPYAGKKRGMQFPMAKGTEVLLTFVDGDPDRPLIAGAINTAAAPGPVTAGNQTESVIQTGGNNKIRIEDKFGSERVMVESPASNSWIRVGATNDPIILNGNSPLFHNKTTPYTDQGALTDPIDGSAGITVSFTEIKDPSGSATDSSGAPYLQVNNTVEGVWSLKYVSGDDTAIRKVIVYDPTDDDATEELKGTISDGIRIRSSGNLWLEAQSRIGNYYAGKPPFGPTKPKTDSPAPSQIGDLIANFSDGYNPTGLRNHVTNLDESLTAALAAGHVHVSSLDTFNTQEGNIYDFGGYWNYNLGNSYAEDHVNQKAKLNDRKAPHDMLNIGGPQWTTVIWPPATGTDDSPDSTLPGAHWTKNQDATEGSKVWVQKKWGNDYEYHEGDSFSVSKGNTLDVIYGGTHIEVKYHPNNNIKSWTRGLEEKEWTSDGTLVSQSKTVKTDSFISTDEKKYDYRTGSLYNHSLSQGTGMGMAKFDFDYSNTVSMGINTGSSISMNSFLGGKISIDNFVGAAINVSNALGMIMSTEFAPITVKIDGSGIESTFPGIKTNLKASHTDTMAANIKTIAQSLATVATQVDGCGTAIEALATCKLTA